MENVTETKPLGLRWRHLTAAARIPQFFRSVNTWDKEVSLSEREKCAVHGPRMDRILLCVSKTFSILHYVINAGLTRHTGVSTTPSNLGIRRDISNLFFSAQFPNGRPSYGGDRQHYLPYYCKGHTMTKAGIQQAKKQTGRASP